MFLTWGFSPSMVAVPAWTARFDEFSADEVPREGLVSAVPYPELAAVLTRVLGRYIEHRRTHLELRPGDVVWAAVYSGPRIEKGAEDIPEGGELKFYRVTIM